ncbi:hypothetical protein DKX38_027163 [Salix brachista]|uniref:1-phosphatidylinositol 4-kinase n=1 Tax=Salix brachista TaxID=2182728 RepID=A0A5N5JGL6_9ROSI|nr:hypothetical protein DKX38_027163 [Salix brachista]
MHRSSSWKDLQQDDWSGPVEILGFSEHFAKVKQMFIPHDFDASDYGTSSFLVTAVHRIGILDVRIKLDGIGRLGQVELIPIDHGLCLPESLEDPYFEWIQWWKASIPFSDDELEYINNPEPFQDSGMLRRELPLIREACLGFLVVCTIFLKAEIGEMMSREFQFL